MTMTIKQFIETYNSDDICLEHIFNARFGQGYECPKCERDAKWYKIDKRRVYSCQWCGHHIYPCAGTLFEDSRTSLQSWFYALYLFSTSRHGVPAKELQRQLGVTYKCAWRMGHQIRKHMDKINGNPPLSGDIEADEGYFGGHVENGRGGKGKTILFGMVERGGDIITKVIPDRKRSTVQPLIIRNVAKGSTIHTDEHTGYYDIDRAGYEHKTTNHSKKEYAKNGSHVNTVESYWSRLKLSIRGTHIHVSPQHLDKYAKEFEYRFNNRHQPERMIHELLSNF